MAELKTLECADVVRLTGYYKVAMGDYSRAVQVLAHSGTMPKHRYKKILEYNESARLKWEFACSELDRHIAEHRCSSTIQHA